MRNPRSIFIYKKMQHVYTDTNAGYFKINNRVSSHLRLQIKKAMQITGMRPIQTKTGISYAKW